MNNPGLSQAQIAMVESRIADTMGAIVSAETYLGESAVGPVYADPVDVVCNIDPTTELMRDSNGEEVVSTYALLVAADTGPSLPPESRITYNGLISFVIDLKAFVTRNTVLYYKVSCT